MSTDEISDLRIAKNILTVYPPIYLCLGLMGNVLSIVVLSKDSNRRTSTGVMLIVLAITDSLILINSVFVRWLDHLFEVDFRNYSNGSCKFHVFFTYLLLQLSPWILVLVTIERIFSVLYPFRVREVFTRRKVVIAMMVLLLFLSGLNAHLMYGFHLAFSEQLESVYCHVIAEHEHFMFKFWPWIDFAFAFAIPFSVLLVGNITIIVKLKASQHFWKRAASFTSQRSQSSARRDSKLTFTAFILNTAFTILVSPFSIFAIGQPYWFPPETMTPERHADLILISTVLLMVLYTNSAINFVLYILCGSKFRRDFVQLFCCHDRRRRSTTEEICSRNGNIHALSTISS